MPECSDRALQGFRGGMHILTSSPKPGGVAITRSLQSIWYRSVGRAVQSMLIAQSASLLHPPAPRRRHRPTLSTRASCAPVRAPERADAALRRAQTPLAREAWRRLLHDDLTPSLAQPPTFPPSLAPTLTPTPLAFCLFAVAVGMRAGEGKGRGAWHRRRDVRADARGGEKHHPGSGEHERDHRGGVHERGGQNPNRSGTDHEHLHDVRGGSRLLTPVLGGGVPQTECVRVPSRLVPHASCLTRPSRLTRPVPQRCRARACASRRVV